MQKVANTILVVLLTGLIAMIGCGRGGETNPTPQAIVTLSVKGTLPAGVKIGGIQARLNLPAGVTAKASPSLVDSGILVTDTGVVVASGSASGAEIASGVYTTGTTSGTYAVRMAVAKSIGFDAGEFATVLCDLAVGSAVTAADFSVSDVTIAELTTGATITVLTHEITVLFP